jgi:hypothetical protein
LIEISFEISVEAYQTAPPLSLCVKKVLYIMKQSIHIVLLLLLRFSQAWVLSPPFIQTQKRTALLLKSSLTVAIDSTSPAPRDDNTDDDEYEYVEIDSLQETDFAGSEWIVGTCNDDKITETWVRLTVDDRAQNVAVWGDGSKGKWNLDVAAQFFSISKEGIMGKKIWAATVDDYYYLQGTVRGWSYLLPASVLGQWQAKRLGVDAEEAGIAPWFQETNASENEEPKEEELQTEE